MEGIHTIHLKTQNMRQRTRSSLRKNVSPKERHVSPREKGMDDPSRRKIPQRFIVPPTISLVQEWYVVQHKKFPQKLTRTQKRQRAMEKRQLPREMLHGKPKEAKNLKEKVQIFFP